MKHFGIWSEQHQCWAANSDAMVFWTTSRAVALAQLEISSRGEKGLAVVEFPDLESPERAEEPAIDLSRVAPVAIEDYR